ncbi:hypothetical protein CRUP_004851, partial [Coryphaenoides rupestris]
MPPGGAEKLPHKPKDKKSARKKPAEVPGIRHSDSGTSSDSSSDGSLSSDLEDLAEDDEDDDDDDDDDDEEDEKQSEASDSERKMMKKAKVVVLNTVSGTADGLSRHLKPPHLTPSLPHSPSPPALSQAPPPASRALPRGEAGPQHHFSVIQSTGLAAAGGAGAGGSGPLPLLTRPHRDPSPSSQATSPLPLTTSASPRPPKLLPSSLPHHLPLSLCSSPKPVSVPSPPPPLLLPQAPLPHLPGLQDGVSQAPRRSQGQQTETTGSLARPDQRVPPQTGPSSCTQASPPVHSPPPPVRRPLPLCTGPSSCTQAPPPVRRPPPSLLTQGPAFLADLRRQQPRPTKSPKRSSVSSSSPLPPPPPPAPPAPPASLPQNNHTNLFLSSALLGLPEPPHPNGVIHTATQEAPLALITKPRKDSTPQAPPTRGRDSAPQPGAMPVNLST